MKKLVIALCGTTLLSACATTPESQVHYFHDPAWLVSEHYGLSNPVSWTSKNGKALQETGSVIEAHCQQKGGDLEQVSKQTLSNLNPPLQRNETNQRSESLLGSFTCEKDGRELYAATIRLTADEAQPGSGTVALKMTTTESLRFHEELAIESLLEGGALEQAVQRIALATHKEGIEQTAPSEMAIKFASKLEAGDLACKNGVVSYQRTPDGDVIGEEAMMTAQVAAFHVSPPMLLLKFNNVLPHDENQITTYQNRFNLDPIDTDGYLWVPAIGWAQCAQARD